MKFSLFVALLVLAFAEFGPTGSADEKADGGVRPVMRRILDRISDLRPLAESDAKFTDPQYDGRIKKDLREFGELVEQIGHNEGLQSPGYRISGKVLNERVHAVSNVFEHGDKLYARSLLNSTLSACMSCHTQLPGRSRDPMVFDAIDESTSDTFETAEFMFATRNFSGAADAYEKLIAGYPSSKLTSDRLRVALHRQIAYYARIKRDPKEAVKKLGEDLKNKSLPVGTRDDIQAWTALFREWSRQYTPDPDTATDEVIRQYAEKALKKDLWDKMIEAEHPRTVTYLQVSGILYEYLHKHPETKIAPNILYWLAICDSRTESDFYFSLSDLYLKECIERYPQSEAAKKCRQLTARGGI